MGNLGNCRGTTETMVNTMENAPKNESRRMKRARLVRDGLSWRAACLQSGYSLATANRGPRGYMENRPGVARDFERAADEAAYKPDFIKKIVTHRLMSSVIDGKPPNVAREAELLGKMRDVDLFVRNADVQLGIFAALIEPPPLDALECDGEVQGLTGQAEPRPRAPA
jgi:hypothetical protein